MSKSSKSSRKIGQKFETPTYNVVADLKEAVYDTIEESGHIDVSEVAQKVFKDNITAQLSFQEEVVEKGFVNQAPMMRDVREISEKNLVSKTKTIEWNRIDRSFGCLPRSEFDRIYQ